MSGSPKRPRTSPGTLAPDDAALWDKIAATARPLKRRPKPSAKSGPPAEKPPELPKPPSPVAPRPAGPPGSGKSVLPPLSPDAAPGVDRRTAERLRRGQLAIEARLDLHGMTQGDAHQALVRFVASSRGQGRRCLLIITGKGRARAAHGSEPGVLRRAVPRWLNEPGLRAQVLAIAPAQPKDGGAGALYLLLKRQR